MGPTLVGAKVHKRRQKCLVKGNHAITQRTGDTAVASRVGFRRYRLYRIPEADWRRVTHWWGS
jgi:hypothetical protein